MRLRSGVNTSKTLISKGWFNDKTSSHREDGHGTKFGRNVISHSQEWKSTQKSYIIMMAISFLYSTSLQLCEPEGSHQFVNISKVNSYNNYIITLTSTSTGCSLAQARPIYVII